MIYFLLLTPLRESKMLLPMENIKCMNMVHTEPSRTKSTIYLPIHSDEQHNYNYLLALSMGLHLPYLCGCHSAWGAGGFFLQTHQY